MLTPHEEFFKHSLSNLTVAKDFLKAQLSPDVLPLIRWDTLKLSNLGYTDKTLDQLHSDLVHTCQVNQKSAYIYVLLEQAEPGPLLAFHILRYNVALLTQYLEQNRQGRKDVKLPIILNLCLYTSKPSPYVVGIYDGNN